MRLTHTWIPPVGTLEGCTTWNNQLVYTRCFVENIRLGGQECQVTRYGIWTVDCDSGETTRHTCPFFRLGKRNGSGRVQAFRGRGVDSTGALVFSLGKKRSYDTAYFVFTFDGSVWRQVESESCTGQEFVLSERRLREWEESDPLDEESWVIAGGELVSVPTTMTFAVDNTHAFAYDSGPESPRSEAYLRAREVLSKLPTNRDVLSFEEQKKVLSLIPEEVREQKIPSHWKYFIRKIGEAFYVSDSRFRQGLVGVIRVA